MYQNGYLHGSRSRGLAKSAIYTAAGCQHKIAIYTAAVPEPIQIYTRLPCVHVKSLFTRQPLKSQIGFKHCCRVYAKIVIYTAAVQEPNSLYKLLPGVYKKSLFTRQPFKSQIDYLIAAGCIHKIVIKTAAVQEPIQDKKRLARGSHTMLIYTAVITEPNRIGHFDGPQRN